MKPLEGYFWLLPYVLTIGSNMPKITNITTKIKNAIIKDYQNGLGWKAVYKKYHITGKTLSELLKTNKIKFKSLRTQNKLNHNYFSSIDTVEKAYWLGFLFADGHNCVEKNLVRFCIAEKDSYILKNLQKEVGHCGKIYIYKGSKKNINNSDSHTIQLFSKKISKDLLNLGMTQRKSLTLKFPKIKKKFLKSFILGYFDGDGSISWHKLRIYPECTVNFIGSHKFCKELAKILKNNFKIKCGINRYKHDKVSVIRFASIDSIKKIYTLFYISDKHKTFLQRKHERFLEYFKERNIKINQI